MLGQDFLAVRTETVSVATASQSRPAGNPPAGI